MSASARRIPGPLVLGASALAALALAWGGARAAEPQVESASYEAALSIPKITADDKEAVEKALADPAIAKVEVRVDAHEAILTYPTTTDPPDGPAEKACERVRKLGGRLATATVTGVTGGLVADWGSVKGFVLHEERKDAAGVPMGPEWTLWVLLKPAKAHTFNGAASPELKISLGAPEGVTLSKWSAADAWSLDDTTIKDKAGVEARGKSYAVTLGLPHTLEEKRLLLRADVALVDAPSGTARVVKLVVPFDRKWYRK